MTAGQPVLPDGIQAGVPTAAERAEWRAQHRPTAEDDCRGCDNPWPCPTIRLLDALDAAEAVLRRLVDPRREEPCEVLHPGQCAMHVFSLPCPVAEGRRLLGMAGGDAGAGGAP